MEKLFNLSKEVHPDWGDYIHLCRAVRNQGASRQEIVNLFTKVMNKDEFDKKEIEELIDYLVLQTGVVK
jgi:hypothetical protein